MGDSIDAKVTSVSHSAVSDSFVTPWTIAHQAPLSMKFSGKNTGVGCHFLSRDLPDPGIEPGSATLQADSLLSEPPQAN